MMTSWVGVSRQYTYMYMKQHALRSKIECTLDCLSRSSRLLAQLSPWSLNKASVSDTRGRNVVVLWLPTGLVSHCATRCFHSCLLGLTCRLSVLRAEVQREFSVIPLSDVVEHVKLYCSVTTSCFYPCMLGLTCRLSLCLLIGCYSSVHGRSSQETEA